jgi:predicted RNA-binding protein with PUA-like domain
MAFWLFKSEPDEYSYADLERDGSTVWEGVSNPVALKNLRAAKIGDEVFFYHTGKEKAIVGVARVSGTKPNPEDEKQVSLTIEPVRRLTPVTLAAIKADETLAEWELARLPRLSVMPVSATIWMRVHAHSVKAEK